MAEVCKLVTVSREEIFRSLAQSVGQVEGQIWSSNLVPQFCQIMQVSNESIYLLPNSSLVIDQNLVFVFCYRQDTYIFRLMVKELLVDGVLIISIPSEVWRLEQRKSERLLFFPFIPAYLLLSDMDSSNNHSTNLLYFDRRQMFEANMLKQIQNVHLTNMIGDSEKNEFSIFRLIDLTAGSFSFLANQNEMKTLDSLLRAPRNNQGKLVFYQKNIMIGYISLIYRVPMVIADYPGVKFYKVGCHYQIESAFNFEAYFQDKLTEKKYEANDNLIEAVVKKITSVNNSEKN